ncbi:MAG: transcription antitermination factor NusB [Chloroflexi bacterium]|nr:transcription antitermination factor NusB [Chloroflexota bacterium]
MPGPRRKARTAALQALYEISSAGHEPEATINRVVEEMKMEDEVAGFARQLVKGVVENRDRIDGVIRRFAPAWPLEQLSLIDLNILRLAIFEVTIDNKLSPRIAINEAVELAKIFGSQSSPKFINGVLGAISKEAASSR